MPDEGETAKHKSHRERNAGRKAEKKKSKNQHNQVLTDKQKNPKAFTFNSAIGAERRFRRKQDIDTKKTHIPLVDRTPIEPPPILVAVVGPPKVGKSLVIQCLLKSFVRQPMATIIGPVTVVSGKKRRITFMECNNDINSMIDIAKVADLVLLLVDASFGFEMEIFEFLNICQVHGMPRIMGVLTHLDQISNARQLRKTKKALKHRFWTEVYAGAKLFYLSGLIHDEYLRTEVKNLARFISVMKFRPLTWRTTHPYLLADRIEDLTPPESIRQDPKVDRSVSLYGYVRGVPLIKESSIHIAGCGDFRIKDVNYLPDPCPLPEQLKKRALVEKEKLIYAPFSGVGGIVYDKDAVYIELGGSHSHKEDGGGDNTGLLSSLIDTQATLDEKLEQSELTLFSGTTPIKSQDVDNTFNSGFSQENVADNGRIRRKVIFNDQDIDEEAEESSSDDDDDDDDQDDLETGLKRSSDSLEPRGSVKKIRNTTEDSLEAELAQLRAQNSNSTADESAGEDMPLTTQLSQNPDGELKGKISAAMAHFDELAAGKRSTEMNDEDSDGSYDSLSEGDAQDSSDDEDAPDLKWKENLAQKAQAAFAGRQSRVNVMKLVYGVAEQPKPEEQEDAEPEAEEDLGGIFRVVTEQQRFRQQQRELNNQEDSVYYSREPACDWLSEENRLKLTNRFVTGKWKESEDAEELLKLDNVEEEEEEEEEVYGDFEDLETGQKVTAASNSTTLVDERQKLLEKKRKLKQQFDAEYDDSEKKSYYTELKEEVEKQAQLNKSEFEGLGDDLRVKLEGFRPGMYVRVEIERVPCEFIAHLDPSYPLVVGGLLHGEENIGFVQARVKKHRWYAKILKTRDPLVLSVGWRRFETLPIYSKLEDNMRHRMLKYTPEHVACMGNFWGPITPQGTGVLAIQNVADRTPGFRIAATGSIVEMDKSTRIVKKLKLTGVPMKIFKKTAFIKDMFNSALEVAKFEGAKIKTVSGIRGQIKKAVSKPEGCFRATFEDKIVQSDLVFCRTWYRVDVPKFYNSVTSLLLKDKGQWRGMRTTGQLKREKNIRALPATDSMYTEIERPVKVFKPLQVPKSLQQALPYRDKPKLKPDKQRAIDKRVAVVRDEKEQKVAKVMEMIRRRYQVKEAKEKQVMKKRVGEFHKKIEAEEMIKLKRQKVLKKQVFRTMSKLEAKEKKHGK